MLILDEPDAHLDTEGSEALNRAIAGLKARNGAAVIVAHRRDAFAKCDRVLEMKQGRLHPTESVRESAKPSAAGRTIRVVQSGPPSRGPRDATP